MDPLNHQAKSQFYSRLDQMLSNRNDNLTNVEQYLINNQHLFSAQEDKKLVKIKLNSLIKLENASSRSPQDRQTIFKIFNIFKKSNGLPSEESHWKDSPQSKWEIHQFRKALLANAEFQQHYEFVSVEGNSWNYLGRGREGIVYLAKEKLSGKLMAIKVKCENDPEIHPYNGEEEVNAVKLFKRATGYDFEGKNYDFFNAKSYISGHTLETFLRTNQMFDGNVDYAEVLNQLKELFTKLIENHLFFVDIAPENFVYNGSHFYLIDLRPLKVCSSEEETRQHYRHEILERIDGISWTQMRWFHPDANSANRLKFLNDVRDILTTHQPLSP